MMLEELQRRNYSQHTTRSDIHAVEDFARRFNRPPDRLGLRHIREYQAELFQKQKLSSGTVNNRLAALRFFYIKTLKKGWSIAETPYSKERCTFPQLNLHKARVRRHHGRLPSNGFIESAPKHRAHAHFFLKARLR
jgi:site-specific recombinase XerD